VQFKQLLDGIEDATYRGCFWIAGDILDPPIGHEIKIEFRPHSLENLRQIQGRSFRTVMLLNGGRERPQDRRIVP